MKRIAFIPTVKSYKMHTVRCWEVDKNPLDRNRADLCLIPEAMIKWSANQCRHCLVTWCNTVWNVLVTGATY